MRSHGARIDQDAADALVQAVGQDLRSLAAAADQLANDFPGSRSPPSGSASTSAAAEAKSFAVADAAFWGRRTVALEELRWALDGGTAPVLVTSAFAGGARGWPATRPRREGCGTPTWPARSACRRVSCARSATSPGAGATGIARAIRAIARADADIKGCRQRRVVHARAARAHGHRAARGALTAAAAPQMIGPPDEV